MFSKTKTAFPVAIAHPHRRQHDELEHRPHVSLVVLERSETLLCRMASPRPFAQRVDNPQRLDPARYRCLTFRREVRSVQTVLDGMIERIQNVSTAL